MFIKKKLIGACIAGALVLGSSAAVNAAMIDTYFGMDYIDSYASVPVVQLVSISYEGGSGPRGAFMPVFPSFSSPYQGMPDGIGSSVNPTYTAVSGGNGETTRTVNDAVAIDWNMTMPYPTIRIFSIAAYVPGIGLWTASGDYTVGLIPNNSFGATELSSGLPAPWSDIYNNPIGSFTATSAPAGYEQYIGTAFGNFRFAAAAAPVPVPAAVWLFGSGLLGLAGVARRKVARSK